jgi:hypothetical protein
MNESEWISEFQPSFPMYEEAIEYILGFFFPHNTYNPRLPFWRQHCLMELPTHWW